MAETKRYNFKRVLAITVWCVLGTGIVVLLVAAITNKNNKRCKAVVINISGVQNNLFIDKKDVQEYLEKMSLGKLEGRTESSINLGTIESGLEKNVWIKKAELFFDNNEVLKVNIAEREPVARIFTAGNASYYIDNSITRLPLSTKLSARVPVFTNFPSDNPLSKSDSNILTDIKTISQYILNNPFWMAQIDQVDITAERTFEMIPKVGNQVILFGTAENYEEKFNNLLAFYKQVETKVGWNKYSKINVEFKGQVVAVKRGAEDIKMDSLQVRELMKTLVSNAQKQAMDSTNNIQLIQPQDDNNNLLLVPANETAPDETVPAKQPEKTIEKPLTVPTQQPKIITPSNPPEKQTHVAQKPFWQSSKPATIKGTAKTNTPKAQSNSIQKPNPPFKKQTTIKPVVPNSLGKVKPKTVMPPKNDY